MMHISTVLYTDVELRRQLWNGPDRSRWNYVIIFSATAV